MILKDQCKQKWPTKIKRTKKDPSSQKWPNQDDQKDQKGSIGQKVPKMANKSKWPKMCKNDPKDHKWSKGQNEFC